MTFRGSTIGKDIMGALLLGIDVISLNGNGHCLAGLGDGGDGVDGNGCCVNGGIIST